VTFRDQPFDQRLRSMGDQAEASFERLGPASFGNIVRFGWNRPPVSFGKMTAFIRYTPDMYASTGELVECVGCGRDGLVKMKVDKWDALGQWNRKQPVVIWCWNSTLGRACYIPYRALDKIIKAMGADEICEFENDHNRYWPILWTLILSQGVGIGVEP
jgi:hypothetical protein